MKHSHRSGAACNSTQQPRLNGNAFCIASSGRAARQKTCLLSTRVLAADAGTSTQTAQIYGWGAATAQGPRPTMEDEVRLVPDAKAGFTYAAVFDGHGGSMSAEWLQEHLYDDVMQKVEKRLLQPDPHAEPINGRPGVTRSTRAEKFMIDLFQQADDKLIAYLIDKKGWVTGASGATGTVALVHPQRAIFASLGDSLAVLCRNGAAIQLTSQHRVYGFGDHVIEEIERVEAAGGWIVDGRVCNVLAVSRAFGDPEFKGEGLRVLLQEGAEKGSWPKDFAAKHVFSSDPVIPLPDVSQVDFLPEDEFLLIATDGLWDCMPVAEACRFARQQFRGGKDAQKVADALVDISLRRYTTDNVAVIVADLRGQEAWQAKPTKGKGNLLRGLFGGSQ